MRLGSMTKTRQLRRAPSTASPIMDTVFPVRVRPALSWWAMTPEMSQKQVLPSSSTAWGIFSQSGESGPGRATGRGTIEGRGWRRVTVMVSCSRSKSLRHWPSIIAEVTAARRNWMFGLDKWAPRWW